MHTPNYDQHTQKDLVSFTRVMGGFFILLTGFFAYRADFTLNTTLQALGGIGIGWLVWGVVHARSTKPLYHVWMWLAFVLNFIMTRVILGILFYLVALPTALMLRIAGKDILGIKAQKASYWKRRKKPTPNNHFEKLYTLTGEEENA